MFTVYHSNQISLHKDLLIEILKRDPNPDPFSQETVLVQSLGMAQWLQLRIAEQIGVTGNVQFTYPSTFLWQQYRLLFPELPQENIFDRHIVVWRLMRLLPTYLSLAEFSPLAHYLNQFDQLKQYQLAEKIAALFDQYLVYRPQWLVYWEQNKLDRVLAEIRDAFSLKNKAMSEIEQNMQWQAILWNALIEDIKKDTSEVVFNTSHRAYLQQRYVEKLQHLTEAEKALLPKRIFIFGISSLPQTQFALLKQLSEYCHIHLFFTNPSEGYWAVDKEEKVLKKLALKKAISLAEIAENQGNPLLTTWGKQGKEFLMVLTENELQSVEYFQPVTENHLLAQVKQSILTSEVKPSFSFDKADHSIQIHACHSKMREVEVLHNQLLSLFEQYPDLSPKDIIVMSPDIDSYAPYINAVFSTYARDDAKYIPFTLSDQKLSYIDPIIASFLTLLSIKERKFTLEDVFGLLDIQAIREKYQLSDLQLVVLREWAQQAGIRAGLYQDNQIWSNYNSWENGLNRLLLGISLKAENSAWQEILALNESYGLSAEIAGSLAKFMADLTACIEFIQAPHSFSQWQLELTKWIDLYYQENAENAAVLSNLRQTIEAIFNQIQLANFEQQIGIEIILSLFEKQLSEQRNSLNFLVGKVNFCTLLPMRAIPFRVVCLLGMNEGDFPRQQVVEHFDLMQYAPQKGDRAKRDDDRYLFLEALLSAQDIFYISYIGQSLTDNQQRLPAILVSQLQDYINQSILEAQSLAVKHHAMTVFSPQNFTNGNVAYDSIWLKAKTHSQSESHFLSVLENSVELPNEIELSELIAYIQSPLKWFFNRQLGVYLEHYDDAVEESEQFNLSGLDQFKLLNGLLASEDAAQSHFFEHAKLSGNLPACHFAELTQTELEETIFDLRQFLSSYLSQFAEVIEIDLNVNLKNNSIRLVGNLPNQFGKQVIQWRVGNLRDKDLIQNWITYLALKANEIEFELFRFYYRAGKQASYLSFKPITNHEARALLARYVEDYLASFRELKWAITQDITDYLKNAATEKTSELELCQTAIESSNDLYLQRVLMQSAEMDYAAIHQRTLNWFEPMLQYIEKETT